MYEIFNDMAKKYGDVFSVKIGPNWCVILNNFEVAKDAFLKKPVEFAGRPQSYSSESVFILVSFSFFKQIPVSPLHCFVFFDYYGNSVPGNVKQYTKSIQRDNSSGNNNNKKKKTLFNALSRKISEIYSLFCGKTTRQICFKNTYF